MDEESGLDEIALDTDEIISRFGFDMRVMVEFVDLLVSPKPPCCLRIAQAVNSIREGIAVLVDHAGLIEAPSVKDYMTDKIWGQP